ncbi:MAG: hypothetical protein AAGI23_13330 [Bacteroidota bacterium]
MTSTTSSVELVQHFHEQSLWCIPEANEEAIAELVAQVKQIATDIKVIGEQAHTNRVEGRAQKADYFILYQWLEQAKSFLLLWRDVTFERHKAIILEADGKYLTEQLEKLEKASEESLHTAQDAFREYNTNGLDQISQRQLDRWQHQQSPWSVYNVQIEETVKQCDNLLEQHELLMKSIGYFHTIENIINNLLTDCKSEVENIKALAPKTETYIRENIGEQEEAKLKKVTTYLEELEKNFAVNYHLKAFLDRWENEKLNLPNKQQFVVSIEEGLLMYREIDLNKNVRQWIDSEILPLLYENWELLERIEHEFKVSIANMRNRMILLAKEEQTTINNADALCYPLENFLEKTDHNEQFFDQLSKQVARKLKQEFRLSRLFQPLQPFLAVPFQNTVSQLRLSQSSVFSRLYNWWNKQTQRLRQVRQSVEHGETLSLSERIVRLIQYRKEASDYLHYASIFQTEGYIGESFFVGRKEELQRIETLVQQWYKGYRGSLLLTGTRFSGKTLMGEFTMNRHFSSNTIILSPNRTIELQGRKMQTTYDLGDALNFIQKYSLNQMPMVWIDDLELWRSPQYSMGYNVRQLFSYFDRFATRIFFLVSMSNWMKVHLSKYYEISKLFQAEINLDRMSAQAIHEAILIRHGATHKKLINRRVIEVSANQFRRLTTRVYKSAEGNIGEALMRWSYAIRPTEEEDKVYFKSAPSIGLPDFLSPDTALLLSAIMMEKQTNEYRLRKLFGAPFNEKYSGILQRLLNIGLIQRDLNGWLEINELIVNDLGRLLERNDYITFHCD